LERDRDRPDSCRNLEWLFQYCEPEKLRDNKNHGRILYRELAHAFGTNAAKVTRLIHHKQLAPWEFETVAKFFKLNELKGFSANMLVLPHQEFQDTLIAMGFGKLAGPKGDDWFHAMAQTTGSFVPEALLSLMQGTSAYRGLGLEGDETSEIPNATCQIGQRYGIALEVGEQAVAVALREGSAYGIMLHHDRLTRTTMVLTTDGPIKLGTMASIFVRPARPQEVTGLPRVALLSEDAIQDGMPRVGFRVSGGPGRRDIFAFLFARRPKLGPGWHAGGATLDTVMSQNLKSAVEAAQAEVGITIRRIVYDAIPA
jgi:hypothetical protein